MKPLEPDPGARRSSKPFNNTELPNERPLALGLGLLSLALLLLAGAVHWLLPKGSGSNAGTPAISSPPSPLLTRPQLLENQQAMPELADFDAQNPPPNPTAGGGPLGTPGLPSSLGTGSLGQ